MSTTVDAATFSPLEGADPALPGDPFSRPRYQYGQLLGAEDFTAEQRYHVLRARLHNALLHGFGVVCGLTLTATQTVVPPAAGLACTPGLALDAQGREILVPETACLDVTGLVNNAALWPDLAPPPGAPAGSARRRAYAVLTYRACLSGEIPAITPPCSTSDQALAYGRVLDSWRLCLEAKAPDPDPLVRDWLALTAPADTRARLEKLIETEPPDLTRLWSHFEESKVLLAVVDLDPVGTPPTSTTVFAVDNSVRALVPDVQTVAEMEIGERLVGAQLAAAAGFRAFPPQAVVAPDASGMIITVDLTAVPLAATIKQDKARTRLLVLQDDDTWLESAPAVSVGGGGQTLRFVLPELWKKATVYQVVLAGGGAAPLLDESHRPLDGFVDEPPSPPGVGRDACRVSTFTP